MSDLPDDFNDDEVEELEDSEEPEGTELSDDDYPSFFSQCDKCAEWIDPMLCDLEKRSDGFGGADDIPICYKCGGDA